MSKSRTLVSLTVEHADGSQKAMEFDQDSIRVGSGSSAHVKLDDEDVSSIHCMFNVRDGQVFVLDLGSDDGTFVAGDAISKETALDDGATVELGGCKITVHFGGDVLAPTKVEGAKAETPTAEAKPRAVSMPEAEATEVVQKPRTAKAAPAAEKTELVDRKKTKKSKKDTGKKVAKKSSPAPTGMPVSERHDSHKGHHVHAGELSASLVRDDEPVNTGNVDVTMLWGGTVLGNQRLSRAGIVRIGDGAGVDFKVSHQSLPGQSFELAKHDGKGVVVNATSGMVLEVNGKPVQGSHRLVKDEVAIVRLDAVEFVIQYSKKAAAIDQGFFQTVDVFYHKILAIALILQIGILIGFFITPHLKEFDEDELFKDPSEFSALLLKDPEEKKEEKKKEDLSGKQGAKHKDEEGKFGKKEKKPSEAAASKKGAPTVDKDKREEDRKIAQNALAALGLSGPDSGSVSNVLGPGGLGSGINNALGGLRGTAMGDAGGMGGLGSRGTGAGGGGSALGIGGLGSGTGRGSGGRGGVDLGGRGRGMTRIRPGRVVHKGSLTKEQIARVVRRFMSQIKFCYEKELNKNPNLEGKLVANWVIGGNGRVTSASMVQDTMKNKNVTKCVTRIIKRMTFPKPKGGGVVTVTYPFVFSSGG